MCLIDIEKFDGHRCQVGEVVVKPGTEIVTVGPFEGTRNFVVLRSNEAGLVVRPEKTGWKARLGLNSIELTLAQDTVISR